jgi:hypothetical protein
MTQLTRAFRHCANPPNKRIFIFPLLLHIQLDFIAAKTLCSAVNRKLPTIDATRLLPLLMPVQNVFILNSTACVSVLSLDVMFICKLQDTSYSQC